ncbi:GNAT family N-acetyltransferase [Paenibacillus sp. GCM10027626]|uniref:GNAT family N-acetyltransferase n=1 Tax=Paenibacillus sp. GCM10027626 TaxID=3273411 RepID=UPI003640AC4A
MNIRRYEPQDEQNWLRCRVLAFLDTAYYDNVLQEKEKYNSPAIELVAEKNGIIVGLLDVELEKEKGSICSNKEVISGMIWHIAVHPDYRRRGIASSLLKRAEEIAQQYGIKRFEAWTRDDVWVKKWYEAQEFRQKDSYLHVFLEGGSEVKSALNITIPKLFPVQVFAHYTGENKSDIRRTFQRVHECVMLEKFL